MIRLAEFLFRYTKDPEYMHYIEYNIYNGIFAQTYWRGMPYQNSPGHGMLTYFLPMKAASKKDWAGEMDSFFCCHGTMVQANAALNRCMYYQEDKDIYVTMFVDSKADFTIGNKEFELIQREDQMNGSIQTSSVNDGAQRISDISSAYANKPEFRKHVIKVQTKDTVACAVHIRIPDWITKDAEIYVNQELFVKTSKTDKFITIDREFANGDEIIVILPIGLKFITLPDDDTMGAFRYGPDVLAGVCEQERILTLETDNPEDELSVDTERQWGSFQTFYKTENQDPGINFKRLRDIGYEPYQIYFKIR